MNTSSVNPMKIAVIGANGKTGRKIVELAIKQDISIRAITRTGKFDITELNVDIPIDKQDKLEVQQADVRDITTLQPPASVVLQGVQACIFVASASNQGGTCKLVDCLGLVNVAKACIENNVSRLIIVSSGGVTRSNSIIYFILNMLYGGIMKAKFDGEEEVRNLYSQLTSEQKANLSYTIIRPGRLNDNPLQGCSKIILNQGDVKIGTISRWDLAMLCIECIASNDTKNTIFECYEKDSGKIMTSFNILKLFKTNPNIDRYEKHGDMYQELFEGLQPTDNITNSNPNISS